MNMDKREITEDGQWGPVLIGLCYKWEDHKIYHAIKCPCPCIQIAIDQYNCE